MKRPKNYHDKKSMGHDFSRDSRPTSYRNQRLQSYISNSPCGGQAKNTPCNRKKAKNARKIQKK